MGRSDYVWNSSDKGFKKYYRDLWIVPPNQDPLFITKNGYGDLVVMSMETYEESLGKLELYQKLAEAEIQLKNGEELLDGEEVFKDLKKKHGRK